MGICVYQIMPAVIATNPIAITGFGPIFVERNWVTQTMRLHRAALLALLIAPVLVTAQGNLGTYEDRIAVEDVMARYVWAVDSLDPEGYVFVHGELWRARTEGDPVPAGAEVRVDSLDGELGLTVSPVATAVPVPAATA